MGDLPSFIGRYEVERLLGEGGMGVLYLARDPVIDRHVALKLLRVNGEDLRRRLVREAQSAGRLQHPNIVTVYDVGDHDGLLYIALEYIDGDTLASLIRDNVPYSAIRKLDIIDEVADGLGYAHQRGIIHRDIKPANLMITRAGLVKVLDFGIARVSHHESREIDGATLIGTPAYMAPEQLEGAEVDARSDIYAVGLVMYELFSGRRAFVGATTADVLQRVLTSEPTPIEQLVPDIDADLARVIGRAMAKQPRDRYQDLQAMRKDLARARRRAMQASADDVTMVVSVPITGPVTPPPRSLPATVVPPPSTPPPATRTRTQEDVALAHLSGQRTTRPSAPAMDETIYAPVMPVASPAARATPPPAVAPTPRVAPVAAPPPAAQPAVATPVPAPPPLPVSLPSPLAARDEGPLPVPLPAVPSTGMFAVQGAGRSTVDAPVIEAVRDRAGASIVSGPASPGAQASRLASAPRQPAPAAPPPVATPGAVQAISTPMPSTRQGVPTAAILVGLIALLAFTFLAAWLAVRSLGLLSGGASSSLFSRTVEPKVAGPSQPSASSTQPAQVAVPPAATAPGTEVPVAVADVASAATPPGAAETPVAEVVAAEVAPAPPAATPTPPVTRQAVRETRPVARQGVAQLPPTQPAVPPAREIPREQPPPAVEPPPPPRPVERREPDPPPVLAPEDEGLALVRAYVAARNTAHASGIRRVWPGVDATHLSRVTSAFSAPLTISRCEISARDAARAIAVCQLTQPGTTGAYAQGHGLTIRRTFEFDLVRQGRSWVIAGLRE